MMLAHLLWHRQGKYKRNKNSWETKDFTFVSITCGNTSIKREKKRRKKQQREDKKQRKGGEKKRRIEGEKPRIRIDGEKKKMTIGAENIRDRRLMMIVYRGMIMMTMIMATHMSSTDVEGDAATTVSTGGIVPAIIKAVKIQILSEKII